MEKKRYALIDWLKAICVVLVIITHSETLNAAMLDKSGLFYLLCVNKAVPCFMFLSGYVYALGAKAASPGEQYGFKRLRGRVLRLTVPTVVYYALYVCVMVLSGTVVEPFEFVKRFVCGNFGSGSYYFAIMLQFTFLAPVLYELIRKYSHWGVAVVGSVNLLYEIIKTVTAFPDEVYRICVLRYLLVIAFGMYLAVRGAERIKTVYLPVMALAGLCYILLPYFTDYEYKIFTVEPWNLSGMMTAFYVMAIMCVLFRVFGKAEAKSLPGQAAAKVGQASYHIMYTQMLYFVVRPAIDARLFDITQLPLWSQYIVDIVVCVLSGLVFCVVDNKILGKFYKSK